MELVILIRQLRRKKCVLGHTWICFVLVNHSERQPNSKATTDTTTTEIASTRFGSIYDCHTNHSWLQRVRQTVALAVVHTSLPLPPPVLHSIYSTILFPHSVTQQLSVAALCEALHKPWIHSTTATYDLDSGLGQSTTRRREEGRRGGSPHIDVATVSVFCLLTGP